MEQKFERNTLGRRVKSMLAVDFRRMFTTRFLYIMVGICLVMPILILVMITMVGGALMLLAYFVGAILGGAIAGLPFDAGTAGVAGIVMCMIAKICLAAVFVSISLAVSTVAKQKTWLSLTLSFMVGMLLFMMIPMMTPLDSGILTFRNHFKNNREVRYSHPVRNHRQ